MTDRHSIVGISADGRRTTLCVNVGTEAETQNLAASLRTLGDYLSIEVVVDKAIEPPQPWTPPPIDLEQVVQRRKQVSRRKSMKREMEQLADGHAEILPVSESHQDRSTKVPGV